MDNKFAIYNFLTGIKCKNKKPTYDEAYKRAFQLAWKDMATHTLKIFDELLEVKNKDDFSKCHNKICEYIVEKFPENKIKYRIDKKDKKETADVEIKMFYTHIDKNIKVTFSYGQAQKLVNMLVKYMYIYHDLYEFECPADVTFNVELYHVPIDSIILKEIGKSNICWSKINDYKKYENIQEKINKKVEEENSFIWELNIWNNRNK